MSDCKEFQGKSLDAAIAEACAYYDSPREKLEIDIVQDAKSGIFGLVGVRKAIVRARRAQLPDLSAKGKQPRQQEKKGKAKAETQQPDPAAPESAGAEAPTQDAPEGRIQAEDSAQAGEKGGKPAPKKQQEQDAKGRQHGAARKSQPARKAKSPEDEDEAAEQPQEKGRDSRRKSSRSGQGAERFPHPPQPRDESESDPQNGGADGDALDMALPRPPLSELDQDRLRRTSREVTRKLIANIVDDVTVDVTVTEDRVLVSINGEDTGLLIGREGQNLSAVQYLAARIISRFMNAQVRIQVDAGDYHSRQDSRLKDLACGLADKVRSTGKSMSTKPLSAYQRRVIHLCLQDDPEIYTRSSGDGAMKRVVIMRRKEGNSGGPQG